MKECRECGVELIIGENWLESRAKRNQHICQECEAAYHKGYYKVHAEGAAAARRARYAADPEKETNARLMRNFGISLAEYDVMLEAQGGGCAVCGKTPEENSRRLCVDHDHATEEIRGLLCSQCNRGLGCLRDNPELCRRAMLYLRGS